MTPLNGVRLKANQVKNDITKGDLKDSLSGYEPYDIPVGQQ